MHYIFFLCPVGKNQARLRSSEGIPEKHERRRKREMNKCGQSLDPFFDRCQIGLRIFAYKFNQAYSSSSDPQCLDTGHVEGDEGHYFL